MLPTSRIDAQPRWPSFNDANRLPWLGSLANVVITPFFAQQRSPPAQLDRSFCSNCILNVLRNCNKIYEMHIEARNANLRKGVCETDRACGCVWVAQSLTIFAARISSFSFFSFLRCKDLMSYEQSCCSM
jgi:hypothetical protein